jgi:hypothetical protein
MQPWEYATVKVRAKGFWGGEVNEIEIDALLNRMGEDGWELATTAAANGSYGITKYLVFTFKRPAA